MSFNSKDLMVSILPAWSADATCPEFTIPTACVDLVSFAAATPGPEGLTLLQQQLRIALGQPV